MPRSIPGHEGIWYSVSEVAKSLELKRMTVWRWARQGKTAAEDELTVIQDTLCNHYYIAEKSLRYLQLKYAGDNRYKPVRHD